MAGIVGTLLSFWKEAIPALGSWWGERRGKEAGERISSLAFPEEFPLFPGAGAWLERLTIGFEGSLIMVAAGAIMGIRVGISLLIGAIIYYGVIGNWLIAHDVVKPGYKGIVAWTLWPATAMMVTSGLLSFALKWRTVLRSLQRIAGPRRT